mgnify:CR=1 FL=1
MKHAILDTNFILTCAKQKIDFADEIPMMGYKIVVPTQVLDEIERLVKKNIPEARIAIGYSEARFLANRVRIFFLLPRGQRARRLHSHYSLTLCFSRIKDDSHSSTTPTIRAVSRKRRTFCYQLLASFPVSFTL